MRVSCRFFRIREFKLKRSEIRDCYHERDTGIGDFVERDSGNNPLNEPRTVMSVDEYEEIDLLSPWKVPGVQTLKRLDCSAILFSVNENYIRCEGNWPKILNGPQGNVASKTAASMKMLKGLEKLLASLRIKPIWCYQPVKTLLHAKVLFRNSYILMICFVYVVVSVFVFLFFFWWVELKRVSLKR